MFTFMIGCGGDRSTNYPIGTSFNTMGTSNYVGKFNHPDAWITKPIKAMKISISLRFHGDSNRWVNNRGVTSSTPVGTVQAPQLELKTGNGVTSDGLAGGTYVFERVSTGTSFILYELKYNSKQSRFIITTPPSTNPYRSFKVIFEFTQEYTTLTIPACEVLNISWSPVY